MSCSSPNERLLWALTDSNENDMKKALDAGADANVSSPKGSCPLHAAALRGSASLINILVQHKAEVDQVDITGSTPLMVAARNGKTNAVKALLQCGAKPNSTRQDTGETALHLAIDGGHPEVVQELLEKGADVNAQTKVKKFTPLHLAANSDAQDLAEILLHDSSCKTDTKDKTGRTAAKLARDEKNFKLAVLVDIYTSPKTDDEKKLVSAIMNRDEAAARMALTNGADANTSSPTGSRPLHVAALKGSASLINILVQHRAKVDKADNEGFTPLMVAAVNGKADAIKALLANNAEPNLERLNTGQTALHMAMNGGSPEVVRALVTGGADINAKTKDGRTLSEYAASFRAFYLESLLKTYHHYKAEQSGLEAFYKNEAQFMTVNRSIKVITQNPVPPSDTVYEVTSKKGRVLILEYINFSDPSLNREGAGNDGNYLKTLFSKMGYEVTQHADKEKKVTKDIIENFRNETDQEDVHCIVVCLLTHGSEGNIFLTKNKWMTVKEVYDYFTDDKCPKLKGKPKLFLFGFCRGSKVQAGSIMDSRGETSNETNEATDNASNEGTMNEIVTDRVSLYAAVPGVSCLRSPWYGSFFVYSVVEIFSKYAHILDVKELARKVNKFMNNDMKGSTTNLESNLTKKFYLNPE